jgi:hypothetical protein
MLHESASIHAKSPFVKDGGVLKSASIADRFSGMSHAASNAAVTALMPAEQSGPTESAICSEGDGRQGSDTYVGRIRTAFEKHSTRLHVEPRKIEDGVDDA